MLSQSVDGGKTWSAARTIVDAPAIDDRNVAILVLSDADWLVCYNTFTKGGVVAFMTLRTTDGGDTWSKPQSVNPSLDARTRAARNQPVHGRTGLTVLQIARRQSIAGGPIERQRPTPWTSVSLPNRPGFAGDEWHVLRIARPQPGRHHSQQCAGQQPVAIYRQETPTGDIPGLLPHKRICAIVA